MQERDGGEGKERNKIEVGCVADVRERILVYSTRNTGLSRITETLSLCNCFGFVGSAVSDIDKTLMLCNKTLSNGEKILIMQIKTM